MINSIKYFVETALLFTPFQDSNEEIAEAIGKKLATLGFSLVENNNSISGKPKGLNKIDIEKLEINLNKGTKLLVEAYNKKSISFFNGAIVYLLITLFDTLDIADTNPPIEVYQITYDFLNKKIDYKTWIEKLKTYGRTNKPS